MTADKENGIGYKKWNVDAWRGESGKRSTENGTRIKRQEPIHRRDAEPAGPPFTNHKLIGHRVHRKTPGHRSRKLNCHNSNWSSKPGSNGNNYKLNSARDKFYPLSLGGERGDGAVSLLTFHGFASSEPFRVHGWMRECGKRNTAERNTDKTTRTDSPPSRRARRATLHQPQTDWPQRAQRNPGSPPPKTELAK